MSKLKSVIKYECNTSIKSVGIFYAIYYSIHILFAILFSLFPGKIKATMGVDLSTIVYLGILGIVGFKNDFKMLLQNGFTRKYIFVATISLFLFITGLMVTIDTLFYIFVNKINNVGYFSIYSLLYGSFDASKFWIWQFVLYMLVCSLSYLSILIITNVSKITSIALLSIIVIILPSILVLYPYVADNSIIQSIIDTIPILFGFMKDGTINYLYPILTLASLTTVMLGCSYLILQKTNLGKVV